MDLSFWFLVGAIGGVVSFGLLVLLIAREDRRLLEEQLARKYPPKG